MNRGLFRDDLARSSAVPKATRVSGPGAAATELTILDAEAGAFTFGAWQNVLISVWKSQATGRGVDRLGKAGAAMAAMHTGLRSNVHLIVEGAALPTPEARAAFARLMEQNRKSLACVAIVLGGSGFWSSALRSAMIGLRLVAPRSFDFRVFAANEELVRWLPAVHEAKTGVRLDPQRLRAVLDNATSTDEP